jgi:hypothetical protein
MIKWMFTISILFNSLLSFANQDFDTANTLYESGKYKEASEAYEQLIANDRVSANLYFNYGNSQYRQGELGKAIWGYELALKLDPDHEDALFNLEFTNAQTIDRIDNTRGGFGHWLQSLVFNENVNFWGYFCMICSFLLAIFVFFFVRSSSGRKRGLLLLMSSFMFVFLISGFVIGFMDKSRLSSSNEGIVIAETVEVKMSPMSDAVVSFSLGAGAKVELLPIEYKKETAGWIQIEINGNKGWVNTGDVFEL